MRKTKIVCTLGPSTDDENVLRKLMKSGMDVARINMSHQNQDAHKMRADTVKRIREELDLPVALLMDTKGPEVRIGTFSTPKITLEKGDTFTLTTQEIVGDQNRCSVSFKDLPKDLTAGDTVLIDDGLIEMRVHSVNSTDIVCRVINGGTVSANKGVNVPDVRLSLPFLSERDCSDIKFAVEEGFDFIAASFVRNANDIVMLRAELEKNGDKKIKIISKIENSEGVKNIDDIIRVSDGIMVARGDLGVEVPMELIPIIQKKLIQKAYNAGKQVITATQMLDSMMKNPRPTRAEATDVANAIYDGTSAIMLSGETAAGEYPVEAVRTMHKIAERTESDIDYMKRFLKREPNDSLDVTSAISHATCTTAHDLGATAIITVSKSGRTARMISKYRPNCPIIGGATDRTVWRQMNMAWGVVPVMLEDKDNTDELFDHVIEVSQKKKIVKNGDLVVITAGVPLGVSGTTNLLQVHLVGDVLVSGTGINENIVSGNLCVCKNAEEARLNFHTGDILVIPETSNELLTIMKSAAGIITEVGGASSHAAIVGLALDKPVIVGAQNATKLLKSGTTVTLDGEMGFVFGGVHKGE